MGNLLRAEYLLLSKTSMRIFVILFLSIKIISFDAVSIQNAAVLISQIIQYAYKAWLQLTTYIN